MALEHDRDQLSSTWSQNGMRTSRNELIEVHRNISVEKKTLLKYCNSSKIATLTYTKTNDHSLTYKYKTLYFFLQVFFTQLTPLDISPFLKYFFKLLSLFPKKSTFNVNVATSLFF